MFFSNYTTKLLGRNASKLLNRNSHLFICFCAWTKKFTLYGWCKWNI